MMTGRDDSGGSSLPATQPLRNDYADLEPVLSGMTMLAGRVRDGHPVHPLLMVGALTCLDAFQRCHDQKVEEVLLPALKGRDDAVADVLSELKHAHQEARERIAALRRLLGGSLRLSVGACGLVDEYVVFLRTHAGRELEGPFTAADRVLSREEAVPLWEAFRRIDEREIRPGERQALSALAGAIDPRRDRTGAPVAHVVDIVAAHVMRPRPRFVRPADTLARAAELMERGGVRELPVVEDGRLCGIVSRTDLQAHFGHLEWTRVDAAMTPQPVVVTPEQSAAAVSRVLVQARFNAVPVIADEATLIGMISRGDMLRAVADHANGDGR